MSRRLFQPALRSAIVSSNAFHYLLHPVDVVDPDADLNGLPSVVRGIERISVPLSEKIRLLESSLSTIAERCSFVTMSDLADAARRDLTARSN